MATGTTDVLMEGMASYRFLYGAVFCFSVHSSTTVGRVRVCVCVCFLPSFTEYW